MFQPLLVRACLVLILLGKVAVAQEGFPPRPPEFSSVEVSAERAVTFRVFAPKAASVRLSSSDLPDLGFGGLEMKKSDAGVWEVTTGAVPAGAYRYSFNVDGLTVVDPRNSSTSESNMNTWSITTVPGSDQFDLKDVPHGVVAQVRYFSKTLNRFRRLHVYTPPGYEQGADRLPVLYLLHGAFDSDASWSTVGQAGQILDNLIAAGKAKPMVVVMPMGHTGPFSFGPGGGFEKQMQEFVEDFQKEIRPLVEQRYRVSPERRHRAIVGLSMGGAHTLDIAFQNIEDYSYVGVMSSGVFGIDRGEAGKAWEASHKAALKDANLRKDLRLVWFATGKDDFLLGTTKATVEMLKGHGVEVTYKETAGGHTWLNWRDYLHEFSQQLFRE